MGYVVFHIDKATSTDGKLSDHIERKMIPKNADPLLTHLNMELIEFPEEVTNRNEAVMYRIQNAGLTRKIGKNQVICCPIILSGSHEDMKRIEKEGRLDQWCADNIQ